MHIHTHVAVVRPSYTHTHTQGLLLSFSISNNLRTVLSLHHALNRPMSKASALAVCRMMELLKCIQYTFHRRSLLVAEHLLLIINHYELGMLSHMEAVSVSDCRVYDVQNSYRL